MSPVPERPGVVDIFLAHPPTLDAVGMLQPYSSASVVVVVGIPLPPCSSTSDVVDMLRPYYPTSGVVGMPLPPYFAAEGVPLLGRLLPYSSAPDVVDILRPYSAAPGVGCVVGMLPPCFPTPDAFGMLRPYFPTSYVVGVLPLPYSSTSDVVGMFPVYILEQCQEPKEGVLLWWKALVMGCHRMQSSTNECQKGVTHNDKTVIASSHIFICRSTSTLDR
jgi:hypothetical protein